MQSQLAQHTDGESCHPLVGLAQHVLLLHGTVLQRHVVGADVVELDVLQVCADEDAEVQRAQVDVGFVLHLAVHLRHGGDGTEGYEKYSIESFHICIL